MNKLFTVNVKDAIKGVIMAVISAVLTVILQVLQNGSAIDWKAVGVVALIAGISYILKNFFSNDKGFAGKI